jgi:hypothetical protein
MEGGKQGEREGGREGGRDLLSALAHKIDHSHVPRAEGLRRHGSGGGGSSSCAQRPDERISLAARYGFRHCLGASSHSASLRATVHGGGGQGGGVLRRGNVLGGDA